MTEPSNTETKPENTENHSADKQQKKTAVSSSGRNKSGANEQPVRKAQRKVTKPTKSESSKASSRRTNPFLWLLALTNFVLLVILGAAGGYFWYSTTQNEAQKQANLHQTLDATTQSIVQQNKGTIDSLKQEVQIQTQQLLTDINSQQGALIQQVDSLQAEINEVAGSKSSSQLKLEVEYLIRMATRKVIIEQDTNQAGYLLTEALELLNNIADPNSFRLRELIAQDLAQLNVKQLENNDDLLIALSTLMTTTQSLSFATPDQVYGNPKQKPSDDIADWWQNIGIVWDNLTDDFLTIEVTDQPLEPFINLQQQELVRGMMQYHLLTARHAVLTRNKELYATELAQVQGLLSKFDQNSSRFEMAMQHFQELQQLNLKQEVSVSLMSYEYLKQQTEPSPTPDNNAEQPESAL